MQSSYERVCLVEDGLPNSSPASPTLHSASPLGCRLSVPPRRDARALTESPASDSAVFIRFQGTRVVATL
eukprot:2957148-Pleurochrysis_carterae.AAC.1